MGGEFTSDYIDAPISDFSQLERKATLFLFLFLFLFLVLVLNAYPFEKSNGNDYSCIYGLLYSTFLEQRTESVTRLKNDK